MEADLVTRLTAAALVATVSWDERPEYGDLPAITLTRIAPGRNYTHAGADALQDPRLQVEILTTSPAERERIEKGVIAMLETPATVGATKFGPAFLNMTPDLPAETLGGGAHVFRRALDFTLFHEPA